MSTTHVICQAYIVSSEAKGSIFIFKTVTSRPFCLQTDDIFIIVWIFVPDAYLRIFHAACKAYLRCLCVAEFVVEGVKHVPRDPRAGPLTTGAVELPLPRFGPQVRKRTSNFGIST